MGFGGPPPPPGGGYYDASTGPALAEWWQRLLARIIDGIIAACVSAPFGTFSRTTTVDGTNAAFRLTGARVIPGLVFGLLYFGLMNGLLGKTLGKMAMGIKVVAKDTGNVIGAGKGLLRALIESVLWYICIIPGLINDLSPLWDSGRQAWHDKAVGSHVIKSR